MNRRRSTEGGKELSGPILSLKNMGKVYPGVVALNGVSVDFYPGSVHALIGENGAGKSTLIKCVTGIVTPDTGEIIVDGKSYSRMIPELTKSCGIEAIYQEFNLVLNMTVGENVFLGREPKKGVLLDRKTMNREAAALLESLGVPLDPDALIETLSPAKMQMVEIAKALSHSCKIMIMDEPTSAITNAEVAELFRVIRELKKNGVAIVYISHRLDEIFEVADEVTVMRDGQTVGHCMINEIDRKGLIKMMVGRELNTIYPEREAVIGDVAYEVQDLWGNGDRNISFSVRAGEILGLGGLVGAGRTEAAMLMMGMSKKLHGHTFLYGEEIDVKDPADAVDFGLGMVSEDRRELSIMQSLSVKENMTMAQIKKLSRFGVINNKAETEAVDRFKDILNIKTSDINQVISELSGGNQQKVAISKWLATGAKVLILDEPTRGIDVGARYEIYKVMFDLAKSGMAIIMISSDMEELLGVSDRIIVFSENEIAGELQKAEFSQEAVLELASMSKKR